MYKGIKPWDKTARVEKQMEHASHYGRQAIGPFLQGQGGRDRVGLVTPRNGRSGAERGFFNFPPRGGGGIPREDQLADAGAVRAPEDGTHIVEAPHVVQKDGERKPPDRPDFSRSQPFSRDLRVCQFSHETSFLGESPGPIRD